MVRNPPSHGARIAPAFLVMWTSGSCDSIAIQVIAKNMTDKPIKFGSHDLTQGVRPRLKDAAGKLVHISAEGKLEDISSYHRKITGSWMQGTTRGDFRLTRD